MNKIVVNMKFNRFHFIIQHEDRESVKKFKSKITRNHPRGVVNFSLFWSISENLFLFQWFKWFVCDDSYFNQLNF